MFKQALVGVALSAVVLAASAADPSVVALPIAPDLYSNKAAIPSPGVNDRYSFAMPLGAATASASAAAASPIPEPETWALLVGGVAAIGFLIFRRKPSRR